MKRGRGWVLWGKSQERDEQSWKCMRWITVPCGWVCVWLIRWGLGVCDWKHPSISMQVLAQCFVCEDTDYLLDEQMYVRECYQRKEERLDVRNNLQPHCMSVCSPTNKRFAYKWERGTVWLLTLLLVPTFCDNSLYNLVPILNSSDLSKEISGWLFVRGKWVWLSICYREREWKVVLKNAI